MSSSMHHSTHKERCNRAGPKRSPSQSSDSDGSTASDDLDPKIIADRDRIQNDIQHIMDTKDPKKAAKFLATNKAKDEAALRNAETQVEEYEQVNSRMRLQIDELQNSNHSYMQESQDNREQMAKLYGEIETIKKALVSCGEASKGAVVPTEKLFELEDKERELKQELEQRNTRLTELEKELKTAHQAAKSYEALLGKSDELITKYGEKQQEIQAYMSWENLQLRNRIHEFGRLMAATYSVEASRKNAFERKVRQSVMNQSILHPRQPVRSQLTVGTMDAPMQDLYTRDEDITMGTIPDPHVIPGLVRVRRRLAQPKARARRPGGSVRPAPRPAELRKDYSERRAASTYLQYKDGRKENFKALKPVGRHNGVSNAIPRKRTRLEKVSDTTRRAEMGLEELVRFYTGCRKFPRHNLPELAEGLKRKISPNPYDKRNDTELSRLMQCFSVKAESTTFVEPPKESESEAKLVAITKTVRPFIPRPDIFTGARYLPKLPKPVSVDQRREWSIKSKSWSLGPGLRKKPSNKIVRFAEQVEYEPEQTTKTWEQEQEQVTEPSRTAPGWSFNWSHLIIAFLLFLLLVSNMAPEEPKVSWKEANTRPDEIVAKLRSAGQSSPHPVIIDFEVGRWSDVDPSIYG